MLRRFVAFVAAVLCPAIVSAQPSLFRAYLSATGNDANPCTLPQPCRPIHRAEPLVVNGGEVWILDSANYNTFSVVLTRPVSILAVPGAIASFVSNGNVPALQIALTGTTHPLALRNLSIGPQAGSASSSGGGISVAGGYVSVENSIIANVLGDGILVELDGSVRVSNTVFRNLSTGYAVNVQKGTASLSGIKVFDSYGGALSATTTAAGRISRVTLTDSALSGLSYGVVAYSTAPGGDASAHVTRCTIDQTNTALYAQVSGGLAAVVTISASMLTYDTTPWSVDGAGAFVKSMGNNHMGNSGSGIGSLTPFQPL